MLKTKKSCTTINAGILPLLLLLFLAIVSIMTAITGDSTHAANNASVGYNVIVTPAISMTVSSQQVSLFLNPASYRPFDSQDLTISVTSNNKPGYELFMSATSTDLTNTDDNTEKINTLPDNGSTGYTESTFVEDKWGYKIGSANYFPFVSNTMINSYNDMAVNHTTSLSFAAKASMTKPAGIYSNTLTFSAIPKVTVVDMQNLDSSLCTAEPTLVSDTRDGNLYTVAKLADGNCWMLDNLRLDLTTASLQSLQGKTNATNQTLDYLKNGGGSSPNTNYAVANWDSTNYYDRPLIATSGDGWDKDTVVTSYGNGSGKIGVYYNFCAASAGSYCYDSGSASGNASQDICPAGWKIPNGDTTKGSYYYLYNDATEGYNGDRTNFLNALGVSLSGLYYIGSSNPKGSSGAFWSNTFYSDYNMNYLYVGPSAVNPQSNLYRSFGFSVRCILQQP